MYTVCVDFDGVIHRYDTPFISHGVIPDSPVAGAIDWLNEISKHFDVVIFTTRASTPAGCKAVKEWLEWHGFVPKLITNTKVPALMYIDDRAWRFEGNNFPSKQQIHRALPWHKIKQKE